jgi:hypothetical protein
LPSVLGDFRTQTDVKNFDNFEFLAYKIIDDRFALWFGALNKVAENGFFYNLLRPSGEYFLPSLSRVFHGEFFDDSEWVGLSHSGFIEVYFQMGLVGGIICFILFASSYSKSLGNLRSTSYLQISLIILIFLGNFILTKSLLLFWIYLGLYAKQNVFKNPPYNK